MNACPRCGCFCGALVEFGCSGELACVSCATKIERRQQDRDIAIAAISHGLSESRGIKADLIRATAAHVVDVLMGATPLQKGAFLRLMGEA